MRGLSKARSMEEGITGESWSVFGMVLGWIDKESFCSEGTIKEDSKCWDELDETEVWFGMEGCVVGLDAREGWLLDKIVRVGVLSGTSKVIKDGLGNKVG